MPTSLRRGTPADHGVDPAAILGFLDALDERPDIEMHSLMVVRHGHVVAEGWWAPYSPGRPQLLYSLSKSFTATAAAFAQAEGLLDLDDTVVSHFPEFDADITDPRSRAVKVRHIAAMAAGHTREMLNEALERDPDEPVRGFLLIPPDREPGTVFAYSQPCTYTLASIVQRNAGMSLTGYLRPRLFDPLGIGHVGWHAFRPGREQGFSGLHARTEDIAKLGLLYLQRGRWEGAQLIPGQWVAEATSQQVSNAQNDSPDWQQGYGLQFWMSRHGYRGDGAFGQFCVILPEQDAVIVTTAYALDMQAILDAMWGCLLPGLGVSAPGAATAQEQLSSRLARLELPASGGGPAPADWEPWASGPFTVTAAAAQPLPWLPTGTSLTSIEVGPQAGGWQVSLIEPGNALAFPVGRAGWIASDQADRHGDNIPVAASGGWVDEQTLRVEVIFLETPHRMDITCSLPGRTAQATWRHPPLRSCTLQELRCPG
ncbi:MAG TPA: serine hydrolase domain-containing protein [Trebonia sp.]|nr:serine hydrolase domain-containing protein [Trebonia sp.]